MTGLSAGMPAVHANATMWSLGTAVASAEETKTTIPISRTPKQISEFGLKPGKYRPPAVKVAGFDPTRPPGGGELSCKPYLGPILHTIGTAVFIHGTSPKGTERR